MAEALIILIGGAASAMIVWRSRRWWRDGESCAALIAIGFAFALLGSTIACAGLIE